MAWGLVEPTPPPPALPVRLYEPGWVILKRLSASPGVVVLLTGVRGSGQGVGVMGPAGEISGPAFALPARRARRSVVVGGMALFWSGVRSII